MSTLKAVQCTAALAAAVARAGALLAGWKLKVLPFRHSTVRRALFPVLQRSIIFIIIKVLGQPL